MTSSNLDRWLFPTKTFTPDSAAYSANDVIGGALVFDLGTNTTTGQIGSSTGHGLLNKILVATDEAINGAGSLWFFTSDLATPVADNGAFALVLADYTKWVATVALNSFVTVGTNNLSYTPDINDEIHWIGTSLYVYYVPSGAPNWGVSKNIYIRLDILTQ